MKKSIGLLGLLCLLMTVVVPTASAQKLSSKAKIYLVTCGPGQNELYSAFGHTAFRVEDKAQELDLIFNYGAFNFNQPNFYLNFARGYLLYELHLESFLTFAESYGNEGRSVLLQQLNLDSTESQALFAYLMHNAQPENKQYYYDYFYNNCATKPRDVLQEVLGATGAEIRWDTSYVEKELSIRDLCDRYLKYQPWGDLGIDLCLGLPMDKKATAMEYTFLPDYLAKASSGAVLVKGDERKPLVSKERLIFKEVTKAQEPLITPLLATGLFFVVLLLLSYLESIGRFSLVWMDRVLFGLVGLLGGTLLTLWFFTDHAAAARNMNILWAFPLYFPFALFISSKARGLPLFIMRFSFVLQLLVLFSWWFLPQDLHPSLIFISLTLALRSFMRLRSTK